MNFKHFGWTKNLKPHNLYNVFFSFLNHIIKFIKFNKFLTYKYNGVLLIFYVWIIWGINHKNNIIREVLHTTFVPNVRYIMYTYSYSQYVPSCFKST